jgi:hypothetical protein
MDRPCWRRFCSSGKSSSSLITKDGMDCKKAVCDVDSVSPVGEGFPKENALPPRVVRRDDVEA